MRLFPDQRQGGGASLGLVLVIMGVSVLVVSGYLRWISTDTHLSQRLNQYERSVAAASAATEKVVAHIKRDFQTQGESAVYSNLTAYSDFSPTAAEVVSLAGGAAGQRFNQGVWAEYQFSDAQGNANRTYVARLTEWAYTNLHTRFAGLAGYAATYRIVANARELNAPYASVAGVKQDIQVAAIPLFAYQVFYGPDLEINPSAGMSIRGRVHCNANLYSAPGNPVAFLDHLTVTRKAFNQKHPNDPVTRTPAQLAFSAGCEVGINAQTLPIGTNQSPAALRSIIEVPPPGESRDSPLGRQRFYNKADLIILVSNNVAIAKSGAYNNFSVIVPWSELEEVVRITGGKGKGGKGRGRQKPRPGTTVVYDGVVSTNVTFFSKRENLTVRCTEIDIFQLLAEYSYLSSVLGRNVRTLYVGDFRTQSGSTQSGVRVVFGQTLPSAGLTVVTPNPLYIQGDYNVPDAYLGTTNTTGSVPAALVADAITVVSDAWLDTDGAVSLSGRVATNTTVNAALVGGIVFTGGGYYSGGLENMPRLLENWTGYTLTLNGCMAVLYPSGIATAPWGANADVYAPPQRQWSYDFSFRDPARLPPSTPQLHVLLRMGSTTIQANSVD